MRNDTPSVLISLAPGDRLHNVEVVQHIVEAAVIREPVEQCPHSVFGRHTHPIASFKYTSPHGDGQLGRVVSPSAGGGRRTRDALEPCRQRSRENARRLSGGRRPSERFPAWRPRRESDASACSPYAETPNPQGSPWELEIGGWVYKRKTFGASIPFSAFLVSTTIGKRAGIAGYVNTVWFVQITAQSIPLAASASGTDFSDIPL